MLWYIGNHSTLYFHSRKFTWLYWNVLNGTFFLCEFAHWHSMELWSRNHKKNQKLSCIHQRVRFCLHLKQRRRVLTEKYLSITLDICELSFLKLTLSLSSLLYEWDYLCKFAHWQKYFKKIVTHLVFTATAVNISFWDIL